MLRDSRGGAATCCMFASPYQLDGFMEEEREELNPNAMTAKQAALLFSKLARRRVEVEQVQADIDAGVPTDESGRLNVLSYAAWLLKEMNRGD